MARLLFYITDKKAATVIFYIHTQLFLALYMCVFICSTGRRPASLCHGLLSVVGASVHALTFSLNIFFSETTYLISMKFYRNVPAMVPFRFLEKI